MLTNELYSNFTTARSFPCYGVSKKNCTKNETDPERCSSCAPAPPAPDHSGFPLPLWVWMPISVSGITTWKIMFSVIPSSNILWCGWDWWKLLWRSKLVVFSFYWNTVEIQYHTAQWFNINIYCKMIAIISLILWLF